ncbi:MULTISPECIES: hypothetical protein [Massilia]|uniref:DUF3784 domain-containing protein n=1 Tax=Massilia haematophila TaxID=457923 RepID=A0ABV7PIM3_9BURK|nr:hypothetical protein [Massilia sp.]HBZ06141.1 hypothetical protein [Massilia sp.]
MPNIFAVFALLFTGIAALLFFAPERRLLNFVDYGDAAAVRRLNRHAAPRMLVPAAVNVGCAIAAHLHPTLSVPLVFLTPLSVLGVVAWIGIGASRMGRPG